MQTAHLLAGAEQRDPVEAPSVGVLGAFHLDFGGMTGEPKGCGDNLSSLQAAVKVHLGLGPRAVHLKRSQHGAVRSAGVLGVGGGHLQLAFGA